MSSSLAIETLGQLLKHYPIHRLALKRQLSEVLQGELATNPEPYTPDTQLTSDIMMGVIKMLDQCFEQAQIVKFMIEERQISLHWLIRDDTTIRRSEIPALFDRVSTEIFSADDQIDFQLRAAWQDRIGAISTLFDAV